MTRALNWTLAITLIIAPKVLAQSPVGKGPDPRDVVALAKKIERMNNPKQCNGKLHCSPALIEMVNDDSKGGLIGYLTQTNPTLICRQPELEKSTINSFQLAGYYERSNIFSLGAFHSNQLDECLESLPLNDVKKKAFVSKYYFIQGGIVEGQKLDVSELAAIDSYLGHDPSSDVACEKLVTPSAQEFCRQSKACRMNGELRPAIEQQTEKNILVYAANKAVLTDMDNQVFHLRLNKNDPKRLESLEDAVLKLKSSQLQIETDMPWLKTAPFAKLISIKAGHFAYPNDAPVDITASVKASLKDYFVKSREKISKQLGDFTTASNCVAGVLSCDLSKIQEAISETPSAQITYGRSADSNAGRQAYAGIEKEVCMVGVRGNREEADGQLYLAGSIALSSLSGGLGFLARSAVAGSEIAATIAARVSMGVNIGWLGAGLKESVKKCSSLSALVQTVPANSCSQKMLSQFQLQNHTSDCLAVVASTALNGVSLATEAGMAAMKYLRQAKAGAAEAEASVAARGARAAEPPVAPKPPAQNTSSQLVHEDLEFSDGSIHFLAEANKEDHLLRRHFDEEFLKLASVAEGESEVQVMDRLHKISDKYNTITAPYIKRRDELKRILGKNSLSETEKATLEKEFKAVNKRIGEMDKPTSVTSPERLRYMVANLKRCQKIKVGHYVCDFGKGPAEKYEVTVSAICGEGDAKCKVQTFFATCGPGVWSLPGKSCLNKYLHDVGLFSGKQTKEKPLSPETANCNNNASSAIREILHVKPQPVVCK